MGLRTFPPVAPATAVAFQVYEVAVLLAFANFLTLRYLGDVKDKLDSAE